MRRTLLLVFLCGSMFAGGCATKQKYDIVVTNCLAQPVTIWLTKDIGPWENGWVPPEQAAYGNTQEYHLGDIPMAPNKQAVLVVTGYNTGPNNPAILRVYKAVGLSNKALGLSDVLAIERGAPTRVDYPLQPGKNDLDIVMEDDRLAVVRHDPNRGPVRIVPSPNSAPLFPSPTTMP